MIQIAITDDHPMILEGLLKSLEDVDGISVKATYGTAADTLRGLKERPVELLLLDLQLPDRNGSEIVPVLLQQHPGLSILVLSSIESSQYIRDMMQKGCRGYLLKSNTTREILVRAITEVHQGGIYLDPELKEQLLQEMLVAKRKINRLNPKISRREQEVLALIAEGLSNQEMADRLFISLRTVETHRYNLLQKLNVKNTAGLLLVARQLGIH
ncbi:MAG: response regulator transcription factor [Sphingobacteriales bacterium]|nr:MAG: response regulator transcription factor [Sphingobacteriales bacterium]